MENFSTSDIQEPKEGIPFEMVLSKIDKKNLELITCPICDNLVWNIIDCAQCGNLFCKKCITDSIAKVSDSCPLCRQAPFKWSGSKALKKLFLNIKLKCPNKSCDEKIEYCEYMNHLKSCKFRKCHCINEGCPYENTLNNQKEMEEHAKTCIFRLIKCKYCGKEIKAMDENNHENTKCSQIVECYFCNLEMTRGELMNKHINNKTDNIKCLKSKVEYYMNKFQSCKEKLEKEKVFHKNHVNILENKLDMEFNSFQKQNDKLKDKNEELLKENKTLKDEIAQWNDYFKLLHNNSFLNKKRKRDKEADK